MVVEEAFPAPMDADFETLLEYCNRTKFRTRFNFVYFVLLAGCTKFSSIRKPHTYTSVSDTTVAVRKFLAYESWQTREYEIFTRTKISAITVLGTEKTTCAGQLRTSREKCVHEGIETDEEFVCSECGLVLVKFTVQMHTG